MDRGTVTNTDSSARRTVASYTSYAEAQRAVDYLSDQKFPVERTAIVAEGLSFVEQVTGRLNYGKALMSGSGSGALIGVIIGLIFGLFAVNVPLLPLVLYGLITGAIAGAILGLVGYAMTGGRRDFTSVSGMQAERYNVMVDAEVAGEAERILAGMR